MAVLVSLSGSRHFLILAGTLLFSFVVRAQFSCPLNVIFMFPDRFFIAAFAALIRFGDERPV